MDFYSLDERAIKREIDYKNEEISKADVFFSLVTLLCLKPELRRYPNIDDSWNYVSLTPDPSFSWQVARFLVSYFASFLNDVRQSWPTE